MASTRLRGDGSRRLSIISSKESITTTGADIVVQLKTMQGSLNGLIEQFEDLMADMDQERAIYKANEKHHKHLMACRDMSIASLKTAIYNKTSHHAKLLTLVHANMTDEEINRALTPMLALDRDAMSEVFNHVELPLTLKLVCRATRAAAPATTRARADAPSGSARASRPARTTRRTSWGPCGT